MANSYLPKRMHHERPCVGQQQKKQCQLRITKSMTNPLNSKDDRALLLYHIIGEGGTGIVSGVG